MAHDRLIDHLFEKEYRPFMRAWVGQCTRGWREDHVVATLHEFAQPTDMNGEQCLAYMLDFPRNIGVPEYQVNPSIAWFDAGAPGSGILEPEPPPAEQPDAPSEDEPFESPQVYELTPLRRSSAPPPPSPPTPSGPTRAELQAQIAAHERNMRAEPGSEEWRDYWRRGGSAACLEIRKTLEFADVPPSAAETKA